MSQKTYKQIINTGGNPHMNPFHKEEELLYIQQGKYNARCRKSDISKFIALIFSISTIFVVLSIYWTSVKNLTEQNKDDLERLLEIKEKLKSKKEIELNLTPGVSSHNINCNLPKDCKGKNPQWYFDEKEGTCILHNLSECDSSSTPFKSVENCSSQCISPTYIINDNPCTLKPDSGPCRGSKIRFHYDHESRLCNKFIYGGCGGNENNFQTVEECENKCDMPEPVSLEEAPCSMPPYRGPCRGNIERWYFNSVKNSCETFIFGGCLSNKNNFLSLEDCNDKCNKQFTSSTKAEKCLLPIDAGNCKSSLPRYGFDLGAKKCVLFNYSGCEGNENRFENLEACERNCSESILDTEGDNKDDEEEVGSEKTASGTSVDCTSKPDQGSCRGHFTRYYFDGKQCGIFIYGGCLGNNNNYESAEKCEEACSKRVQ